MSMLYTELCLVKTIKRVVFFRDRAGKQRKTLKEKFGAK